MSLLVWRRSLSRVGFASREWCEMQIRDKLPYPFEDKGKQSIKNIARRYGSMLCALKPWPTLR
jgi:hypothetical protein